MNRRWNAAFRRQTATRAWAADCRLKAAFRFTGGKAWNERPGNSFDKLLLEQRVRTPLTRPAGTLSPRPTRGEGRGEGCAFGFMAGEQVRTEQGASHESKDRSAGFQPAVSPTSSQQSLRKQDGWRIGNPRYNWKSALRSSRSRCATLEPRKLPINQRSEVMANLQLRTSKLKSGGRQAAWRCQPISPRMSIRCICRPPLCGESMHTQRPSRLLRGCVSQRHSPA